MYRYADISKKVYIRFLFALISFILMSACPNQVWAYEELRLAPETTLTIPLTMNEEKTIEAFDILISGYDPLVLELTDITLNGGILETHDYILSDNTSDSILISIYTFAGLATGSGDIAFISFDVKDKGTSMLTLATFSCNESPVAGGFYVNGTVSDAVKIEINETPVARDDELETDEDAALSGTLSASDGNDDPLVYSIVDEPSKGTVEITDENKGAFVYTPGENENGEDSFTFKTLDGMLAESEPAEVTITILPVNDAPELDDTQSATLSAIIGDQSDNMGNTLAEILPTDYITDIDGLPLRAMAVTAVNNSNGKWQYSADSGNSWTDFSTETGNADLTAAAPLLDLLYRIRFVPGDIQWGGTAAITFRAWDKSQGSAGETADASQGGGTSAFSSLTAQATIEVSPANHAPVLDAEASPRLSSVMAGTAENDGNSVSEIVTDGSVSDEDADEDNPAAKAIAVISADNSDGIWQYSTDNGLSWQNFSDDIGNAEFETQARLLTEDHRIRFAPNEYGVGTAAFTFRAWDKSSGTAGETADASESGGVSAFSEITDQAEIEILPANKAPVLDPLFSPELSSVRTDAETNMGNSVAEIVVDDSVSDEDADEENPAPEAIGVISVDNSNGVWQYSVITNGEGGDSWTAFSEEDGNVNIISQARLLDEEHRIRFLPNEDWFGTATFTFRAWDKSRWTAGETADAGRSGEYHPFSIATEEAIIEILPPNNSPSLDADQSPELARIRNDITDNAGNSVAEIVVDGSVSDEDADEENPAPEAVAVISVDNTDGIWEYSVIADGDGGDSWTAFSEERGVLADISAEARLLDKNHRIRFVPDEGWTGTAVFSFRAWDKTAGTAGETADASQGGISSAFSELSDQAAIVVLRPNRAPVLDSEATPSMGIINKNNFDSSGRSVSDILVDGSVSDEDDDPYPTESVAVIMVDNTNGIWQYFLKTKSDEDAGWENFTEETGGEIDISAEAVLLDEPDIIRFVPLEEWQGVSMFRFRAWDKSDGSAGQRADAGDGGGISRFSETWDVVKIRVEEENQAPVLNADFSPALSRINPNYFDNRGDTVSDIIADGSVSDANTETPPESVAVVAADNTNGKWQYAEEQGMSWNNFSEIAGEIAEFAEESRLLDENWRIRFVPDEDWQGSAKLTFRAWDKTRGIAGETTDTSETGGSSSFSEVSDKMKIRVRGNKPPELDTSLSPALHPIRINEFDSPGNSIPEILPDAYITDRDGEATESLAVIGVDNASGFWQYAECEAAPCDWLDFTDQSGYADISENARLLDETHRIRFVPDQDWDGVATFDFRAWDKTSGLAGETADSGEGGGFSAFSADTDEAGVSVTDMPIAHAGEDRTVFQRQTAVLDGSGSSGMISTYQWEQTEGMPVEIADTTAIQTSFTAPEAESDSIELEFTLTVRNDGDSESSDRVRITVLDAPPPAASFDASRTSGNVPLDVSFTDTSRNEIREWLWDFGDGFQSFEQHPTHTYPAAGTYTVSLTVSGPGGQDSVTKENHITVSSAPLESDFEADILKGPAPLTVSFTRKIQGEVASWLWDFGDGKTGTEANPIHVYETPETYSVSLTVTGTDGSVATETKNDYVKVTRRSISGQVIAGDTGEGLRDCWVEVWAGNVFLNGAETNRNGEYKIGNLPAAGNLVLMAIPPEDSTEYFRQFYKGESRQQDADTMSTIGNSLTDIDFVLERKPEEGVRGRVHDGEEGISGIEVRIFSGKAGFGMNVITDKDGYYLAKGLKPADDYHLSVWSEAFGTEFFYGIPENATPGEYVPETSVFNQRQATFVMPAVPPLSDIDIIANAGHGGFVSGHVYGAGDETPLADIAVNAWSEGLNTGNSGKTDQTGAYIIWGLEPVGEEEAEAKGYLVEIASPDYPYQAYDRTDAKEEAVLVPTGTEKADFYLKKGYSISGKAEDADGNPIPELEVSVWSVSDSAEKQRKGITDENGVYSIPDLPLSDDYLVAVFPSDYSAQYYHLSDDRARATPVDISQGDAGYIDFVLNRGETVSGRVWLGDKSTPADQGVWVGIWSDSDNSGMDVQTDGQGRYEIWGLKSGVADYILSVRHEGYATAFYHQDGTVYSREEAGGLTALRDEDRDIVLIRGFSISGTVSHDEEAIPGIRIAVTRAESGEEKSTLTTEDEPNYIITGLLPGTYDISIFSDEFVDETRTAEIGNSDVVADFALSDEAEFHISGTITGLEPGKILKISASSLSRELGNSVRVKGIGEPLNYTLGGLKPASDYVVELISEDHPYQVFDGKYKFEKADIVNLSDGDARGIDFFMASPDDMTEISGEIIFPADALPGDQARVDAYSPGTGSSARAEVTVTDSQIIPYLIRGLIRSDDYLISVHSDKYIDHYYDGTDQGAPNEGHAETLDLSDSAKATVIFRLSSGKSISGRVTDGSGAGLSGIHVETWSDSTGAYAETYTSSDGYYVLEGLPSAPDYKIEVREGGGSFFHNTEETVRNRVFATSVNTELRSPENTDITISQLESISGIVTDRNGNPLPLMWVDASSELKGAGNGLYTDRNGSYQITGLPESGDYSVSARPDWFTVPKKKENISSGSSGVNFILNPDEGYTIKGTVTDNTGAPVSDVTVEIWSEVYGIRGDIWAVTDHTGIYELKGIPTGNDYVLMAWPAKDSGYAFSGQSGVSVPLSGDTLNMEISPGVEISGLISGEDGSPVPDAQVIASTAEGFLRKAVGDKNGRYRISNVPQGSDCEIVVIAQSYLGERKIGQTATSGINFTLNRSGSITGTVRDKVTGEVLPGVYVEAYSDTMRGLSDFSGVAVSNSQGVYVIQGLRPSDGQGKPLNDYVITVHSPDYPPHSVRGRSTGGATDFTLSRGPENEISGTIMGLDGEIIKGADFMAEVFEHQKGFVNFMFADSDGSFRFANLEPEKFYLLKFTAIRNGEEILIQWGGEGDSKDYDMGVEDSYDPDQAPGEAKIYSTDTGVHFRFSRSETDGKRYPKNNKGPGPVKQISSGSHLSRSTGDRRPSSVLSSTHTLIPSSNPYATVSWEPSESGYDESYFYAFNQISDHEITKRNAPRMLPITTKTANSAELTGNNLSYYFHVAAVDDRGKIGPTASQEFRIDTVPPSNGTVLVPEQTSEETVLLILGVTDAKEMYISNINYAQGNDWETRVKEKEWRLSDGDGSKNIHIQFRDEAGNIANYLATTEKTAGPLPPELTLEDQSFSVNENSPGGTIVGTVMAGGPEGISYFITRGNAEEMFAISPENGEITISREEGPDYETVSVYTLTVGISDDLDTVSATVTVNVRDMDEDRLTMNDQSFSLDENSPGGTPVGTVAANSPLGILNFAIVDGDPDSLFAIDADSGQISISDDGHLDYETKSVHILTVEVSDGADMLGAEITINIRDVDEETPNSSPEAEENQIFSIDENSPAGTVVGLISANDADGDELSYEFSEGNSGNAFAISLNGEITVDDGTQLDYESTDAYLLTVRIFDGRDAVSVTVTVNVNDVNEDMLFVDDQSFSVQENSADGTPVGTVVASGPVPERTYAILDGNAGEVFAIDSGSGEISVADGGQLDYEAKTVYDLTVQVSDGTDTASATITINIGDVNEGGLNVSDQNFSVNENSSDGVSVGTIVASSPLDTLSFEIAEGNADRAFAIDGDTGQITVADAGQLDYETKSVYILEISVSDGKDTETAIVTININDQANENRPLMEDQSFSVEENSINGTVVGMVTASDADPEDTLTYAILSGNTNNAFSIAEECKAPPCDESAGEITVNDGSQLDYESMNAYLLTVQVSDGTNTTEAAITINILDVNEDRLSVKDQNFSVDENSPKATAVGRLVVTGPSDELFFSIVEGNTNDVFSIDRRTGHITVTDGTRLDYETKSVYTLMTEVSDEIDSVTTAITVNVNDVNEERLVVRDQAFSIDADTEDKALVGSVVASGPSANLTFIIIAGNSGDTFAIGPNNGEITVSDPGQLNYDLMPVYKLTIEVSDSETTETAIITINVNKPDALINNQTFFIDEKSPQGTSVGTIVLSSDDDPEIRWVYAIIQGNDTTTFAVNSETGELTVAGPLDYETAAIYVLTIQVSDGENTDRAAITVNVNDADETGKLTVNDQSFSVREISTNGTVVGEVKVSGAGEMLTFGITEGNTGNAFAINAQTGEISVNDSGQLDYVRIPVYSLTVRVSDGENADTAMIFVNIAQKGAHPTANWTWQNPLPTGNAISSIRKIGDSVFAAGNTGTVLRFDDTDWMPVNTGTKSFLRDMWGTSESDIHVVGDGGTILRFDGQNWREMDSGTSEHLRGVWQNFIVGHGGTILRFDGTYWTRTDSGTANPLYGIWGNSESEIFAVGDFGIVLRFDGAAWDFMNSGTSEKLAALWGNSEELFAVGDVGTILRFDGSEWGGMDSGTSENLISVWGNSASDVFAAGEYGTILRFDGQNWSEMDSGASNWLYSIWGNSRSDVFAGGHDGLVLHYDGSAWHKISSGIYDSLKAVRGNSESDIFAVGGGFDYATSQYYGSILHYDGTRWERMNVSVPEYLHDIWTDGETAFAAGWGGVILYYDGSEWRETDSGTTDNLRGIWGSSASNVFAAGDAGTILRFDGNRWSRMESSESQDLYCIWGSSESDIFAVGDAGALLRFDGAQWRTTDSGTSENLSGVWGSSGSDVFAVGEKGIILYFDGSEWETMESGSSDDFRSVWGQTGDSVFVSGDKGLILHYNGDDWAELASSADKNLRGIWGTGNRVFTVGDDGTILSVSND